MKEIVEAVAYEDEALADGDAVPYSVFLAPDDELMRNYLLVMLMSEHELRLWVVRREHYVIRTCEVIHLNYVV